MKYVEHFLDGFLCGALGAIAFMILARLYDLI